jgi:thiamine pyrophosphokinase
VDKLPQIVNIATKLTLLGGGAVEKSDLEQAREIAPVLVAADGGANIAFDWGVKPDAVVGDLDSVDRSSAEALSVPLVFVDDQNSTDLEKCLQEIHAGVVVGVGFFGGRLDHQMAALNALSLDKARCVVLVGAEDIVFRAPKEISLKLCSGDRVSLFPMSPCAAQSTGLEWQLKGLPFQPNGQIGCSNVAVDDSVNVQILSGDMLMILPKHHLKEAIGALCHALGISTRAG